MADFEALIKTWQSDYTNGDLDKCLDMHDEQCKTIAPGEAIVIGKAAIKRLLQAMRAEGVVKILHVKMVSVTPLGESYAVTIGEEDAYDGDGKVVSRYNDLIVWKKDGGKWLILSNMYNDRK